MARLAQAQAEEAAVELERGRLAGTLVRFQSGFIKACPDNRSIPHRHDLGHLFRDEWKATEYLVDNLVIGWPTSCVLCGGPVSAVTAYDPVKHDVVNARGNKKKIPKNCFLVRCRKDKCTEGHARWTQSIWKGTMFDGTRKKKSELLEFFYWYLLRLTHTQLKQFLGWSDSTVTDWMNYCREMFHMFVMNDTRTYSLGGQDIIVEIDESKFGKRRYNRGHRVEGNWVFGGSERIWNEEKGYYQAGKIFLEVVDRRDVATLIPLIQKYIRPGSIVYSDYWRAYGGIPDLPGYNFKHGTVCHDRHFKDPVTGVHTNTIEGRWARVKAAIPCRVYNLLTLQEYLSEYVWRHHNKGRIWNAFLECLAQIRYDGDQREYTFTTGDGTRFVFDHQDEGDEFDIVVEGEEDDDIMEVEEDNWI